MATIQTTTVDRNSVNGITLVTWDLADADDGAAIAVPYAAEITVHATGTFGGATVALQGSNDGTNWATLTRKSGTSAASFTSADLHTANENPAYIRVRTTGGTGTAVKAVVAIKAKFAKVSY